MIGTNYANAQYQPGTGSLFSQKATFDTLEVITTYQATPAWMLAAGYSYTRQRAANGINDPASYHQIALEGTDSPVTMNKNIIWHRNCQKRIITNSLETLCRRSNIASRRLKKNRKCSKPLLHKGKSAARKQTRARILLKAAAGSKDAQIMDALAVSATMVYNTRQRERCRTRRRGGPARPAAPGQDAEIDERTMYPPDCHGLHARAARA